MIKPWLLFFFFGRGLPVSSSRRDFLRGRGGVSSSAAGAMVSTAATIFGSGSGALMIMGLEHFGHFTVLPMAASGALIFAEQDGQMMVSGIGRFPLRGE